MNKSIAWNTIRKLSVMTFFINLFFLSPVMVFFYQQRGLDYFQILSLESILAFFVFLFQLPTGILADKSLNYTFIFMGILIATSSVFLKINESHVEVINT